MTSDFTHFLESISALADDNPQLHGAALLTGGAVAGATLLGGAWRWWRGKGQSGERSKATLDLPAGTRATLTIGDED